VVAGIDEETPGYKKIKIQPHIGDGLTHVAATYKTYYGMITSSWTSEKEKLTMNVEIPVNATATIYIPANTLNAVTENGTALSMVEDIQVERSENGVIVKAGSGKYEFIISK
jgi:alpha-L-rhamnosidase